MDTIPETHSVSDTQTMAAPGRFTPATVPRTTECNVPRLLPLLHQASWNRKSACRDNQQDPNKRKSVWFNVSRLSPKSEAERVWGGLARRDHLLPLVTLESRRHVAKGDGPVG